MDRSGRRYTQYKNFKIFTESVEKNDKLFNDYKTIINSTKGKRELLTKVNDIEIDESWVNIIYDLLPYVSLAINENRRFIRNQSETLPVEKAKRVGREAIIDLAVNSKNIRKINENDEVEPSKVLVVEKLDDFSIYENKFLVYLLRLLKSFIDIRFSKIKEAKSLFESKTKLSDRVNLAHNSIEFNIELSEERHGSLSLEENDANLKIIEKINQIEAWINQLFKTELIEQVSKTPSIKPPIQRTNVLKQDPNFSKALKLYDFISTYSDLGFKVIPVVNKKENLTENFYRYFSKLPSLIAFLSYAEAKEVYEVYEKNYEEELEENRIAHLSEVNRKIQEMIGNKVLDKELVYDFIINMQNDNELLKKQIDELKEEHVKEIGNLKNVFEETKKDLISNYDNKIALIQKDNEEEKVLLNLKIASAQEELKKEKELSKDKIDELTNELIEAKARLKAKSLSENKDDNASLSEDYFNNLEKEKIAFDKYFDAKWKQMKKQILKDRKAEIVREIKDKKKNKRNKK